MPYKLRSFSMYRKMRKKLDRLLRIAGLFLAVAGRYQGEERGEGAIRVVKATMRTAINSYFIVDIPNELVFQRKARTFASFSHFECYRRFRLRKTHLQLVFGLLQFPTEFKLDNRSKLTGEEVFMVGLNRFTSCGFLADLVEVYGRDHTQWSRAFHWFIHFMISRSVFNFSS